eukprot:COSAG02_NODE_52323_length_308_cov_1.119617_1_plen_41_part_10
MMEDFPSPAASVERPAWPSPTTSHIAVAIGPFIRLHCGIST